MSSRFCGGEKYTCLFVFVVVVVVVVVLVVAGTVIVFAHHA